MDVELPFCQDGVHNFFMDIFSKCSQRVENSVVSRSQLLSAGAEKNMLDLLSQSFLFLFCSIVCFCKCLIGGKGTCMVYD